MQLRRLKLILVINPSTLRRSWNCLLQQPKSSNSGCLSLETCCTFASVHHGTPCCWRNHPEVTQLLAGELHFNKLIQTFSLIHRIQERLMDLSGFACICGDDTNIFSVVSRPKPLQGLQSSQHLLELRPSVTWIWSAGSCLFQTSMTSVVLSYKGMFHVCKVIWCFVMFHEYVMMCLCICIYIHTTTISANDGGRSSPFKRSLHQCGKRPWCLALPTFNIGSILHVTRA